MQVFYSELADLWPLISPVEEYADEAGWIAKEIAARAPSARTLLELGSGGGHVASYLETRFSLTLTDLSAEMLAVSKGLNPECDHAVGDMRTLALGRTFDVVLAHDAIDYMTTEADLEAAVATAARHLTPGGLAVFLPDHVTERYEPGTECGGCDAPDGSGVRYLEWTEAVAPGSTTGTTHYSFLVRDPGGSVRSLYEAHPFGLFQEATWVSVFERRGFEVEVIEEETTEDRPARLMFVGRKLR
jgi:SAM-dependent methyltransferase